MLDDDLSEYLKARINDSRKKDTTIKSQYIGVSFAFSSFKWKVNYGDLHKLFHTELEAASVVNN